MAPPKNVPGKQKIESPWCFLAELEVENPKQIGPIMILLHNELIDDKRKAVDPSLEEPCNLSLLQKLTVARMLIATEESPLLKEMVVWFASHWNEPGSAIITATKVLRERVTRAVRYPQSYQLEYARDQERWVKFVVVDNEMRSLLQSGQPIPKSEFTRETSASLSSLAGDLEEEGKEGILGSDKEYVDEEKSDPRSQITGKVKIKKQSNPKVLLTQISQRGRSQTPTTSRITVEGKQPRGGRRSASTLSVLEPPATSESLAKPKAGKSEVGAEMGVGSQRKGSVSLPVKRNEALGSGKVPAANSEAQSTKVAVSMEDEKKSKRDKKGRAPLLSRETDETDETVDIFRDTVIESLTRTRSKRKTGYDRWEPVGK